MSAIVGRPYTAPVQDHFDMARLANGDEQALESLMRLHAKRLLRQMVRMVRNRADAEDIVSESFLRVFRHRGDFNNKAQFSTWLYAISSHLAIDLLRRRARVPEHSPLAEAEQTIRSHRDTGLIDPSPTPRERLAADERTTVLDAALARIPDKLRVPLTLVAFDNCSHAEIAAQLGCSSKAVELRIYHARTRLRAELQKIWRCGPLSPHIGSAVHLD